MARRAVVHLVDDLDDTVIENGDGQTVKFGIDGTTYELDLTNDHADELRGALARYVEAARKTGTDRTARAGGRSRTRSSDVDPVAVRQWAWANGISVSARGRVSQKVIDQFRAAGN